jgi:hypothetical protein
VPDKRARCRREAGGLRVVATMGASTIVVTHTSPPRRENMHRELFFPWRQEDD